MSDESIVSFANDDGHKNRWGLDALLYRKEGNKKSLNGKVLAGLFGSFMLVGMSYSVLGEFFRPTPTESSSPIGFNEQMSPSQKIQVPTGDSELNRPAAAPNKSGVRMSFSGPQVIERPNFGKIPPGTMVKAKFVTGASNGPLKAVLKEDLSINGESIAPEGTVLVGVGSSNEERLMAQFTKLVFKDGKSQNVQAQACDLTDQTVGLKGKKISKYAIMLATGAGLNFLGGLAEGLQEHDVQGGVVTKKNDLRNAALNGASKAALEQSGQVLSDIKNSKSVVQVESGKEFYILFEGE